MVVTAAEATNKHMDKVDAAKTTLIETGTKVKDGIDKQPMKPKQRTKLEQVSFVTSFAKKLNSMGRF